MRLAAIVLHFRFWPAVRRTLDALLIQTRPADQIFIVDNCSRDGSLVHLREAYPSAEVIEAPSNGGYAAGMNLGMRRAQECDADAILLLTAECLLAPNALSIMLARLEGNPALGVAGPVVGLLSQPEKVWSAGGRIDGRTWDVMHVAAQTDLKSFADEPPRRVDWLDGCCVLLRAETVRRTGPMDEGYFIQYEEIEYQLRLRLRGWTVECVPAAVAWQEPGTGFERLVVRNRLRFISRNAPRRLLAREILRQFYYFFKEVLSRQEADRNRAKHRALGMMDYLLRRQGIPPGFERRYTGILDTRMAAKSG